ncbi:MAG: biotin--[Eggerthellaceae bacterium]|nr:biotin--[acetyl-CoA-carboxylase] ligase [Eggerthellaceae bacterium]
MANLAIDTLSLEGIQKDLTDEVQKLVHLSVCESTTSTNEVLKDQARIETCPYFALAAREQTAGKGRRQKSFYSPKDCGVYLSLVVPNKAIVAGIEYITPLAAVAVCRALKQSCGIAPDIKWINDIYYKGNKLCGILCETIQSGAPQHEALTVIGVGINVYSEANTVSNNKGARSTQHASDPKADMVPQSHNFAYLSDTPQKGLLNKICAKLINELITSLEMQKDDVYAAYKGAMFLRGQDVYVTSSNDKNEAYRAHVIDLHPNLQLEVQLEDGSRKLLNYESCTLSLL